MMFLETQGAPVLAISQPAHAWVAGQLLRAWPGGLDPQLLLAAEQHDVAWLDWETRPVFDPATGCPKLFRDIGAAEHAPVWSDAVRRAYFAWGARVALMISRHGGVIYTRFTDRHRVGKTDAAAATAYLDRQAPLEAAWAHSLGLAPDQLDRETNLIAFADTLSLGLCGGITLPLDIPDPAGGPVSYRMQRRTGLGHACTLSPWPFTTPRFDIKLDARPIPDGRFANEAAMRAWLKGDARSSITLGLTPPDGFETQT